MRRITKSLSLFVAFTMVFNATLLPVAQARQAERVLAKPQVRAGVGDVTDTDEDGITDLEEGRRGTNPNNKDTDFDQLEDLWEVQNGLDPLNPDLNDDGLLDYQEIALDGALDISRDSDGDGQPNIQDEDNDNDGVPDAVDLSPFAKTESHERFSFRLQTQGKPVYFNITVRPADPAHLALPGKAWDWPLDEQGQMQDMDYSKEDLQVFPALEFSSDGLDGLLSAEDAEAYGINLDGDLAHVPLTPVKHEGETVALSGKLFLPANGEPMDRTLEARLVWMVQGTSDKSDLNWSGLSDSGIGDEHQGGGAAFADLNGNGKPELLLMGLDAPEGTNGIRYRIGWDMDEYGNPVGGWGEVRSHKPAHFPLKNDGGGLAVGDIDRNGRPDLLVFAVDDKDGANDFLYLIGWNLDVSGTPASWSEPIRVDGIGHSTDGGGGKLYDIDGNGRLDLLLMAIDDPSDSNKPKYRIGWNLDDAGEAASWSAVKSPAISGYGDFHRGGGLALGDLDGNGQAELVLMGLDSPDGPNRPVYVIGWNLDAAGNAQSYSGVLTSEAMGDSTAGGGADLWDLNQDGRLDLLLMAIDDPSGQNEFRYRIGWDMDDQGSPSDGWGGTIAPPDSFDLGHSNDGGGAAVGDIDRNGVPDLLMLAVDDPEGANGYRYRIGWNLGADGHPSSWSSFSAAMNGGSSPSYDNSGAGVALGDIDGNGILDLLFAVTDKSDGSDEFRYQVGWNLSTGGTPASWSGEHAVDGVGYLIQGAGAALADFNGNGVLDLLLMAVDNSEGANSFRYLIGADLGADGLASGGWGDALQIQPMGIGHMHAGAGVEVADLDGNGLPELLLLAIDDGSGTNEFQYLLAWNLDAQGYPQRVTQLAKTTGIGSFTSGGGAAIADLDGDGWQDLMLMGVDNPDDADEFRYRVLHRLGMAGWGFPVHSSESQVMANSHAGGGMKVADIDQDGKLDMLQLAVRDQSGGNPLAYRVGWSLNPDGKPAYWGAWKEAPAVGDYTDGGGIEVGLVNDNDIPDLILMAVDDPSGGNGFRYRIGWDLNAQGEPTGWSGYFTAPVTVGFDSIGGGLAIGHINDNDRPDLVLMAVDDGEADENRYVVAFDLGVNGTPGSWSSLRSISSMGSRAEGGGIALADLNDDGKPELVSMAIDDPDGANGFRYRIGWSMKADGSVARWSRSIEVAAGMLHKKTTGGGAAIADVSGDGKLDLLLMAIEDVVTGKFTFNPFFGPAFQTTDAPDRIRTLVGKGIETEGTVLARYAEDALVTGFSAQENHGTEVGVFHDEGDRDKTAKGYVYLYYEYLNTTKALADAFAAAHDEPYNLTLSGSIEGYAHQEEALKASSEMIKEILEQYSDRTAFPVLFAMTDRSAGQQMEALLTGGAILLSGSSFTLDLRDEDIVRSHALKMPWYDATELAESEDFVFLPLSGERLADLIESWGMTDEEEVQAAEHLLLWDEGESRITGIDDEDVYVSPNDIEQAEALNWVSRGLMGFAGLLSLPSRAKGVGMFYRAWHRLGRTLKSSILTGQAMYRAVSGSRSVNVKWLQSLGKPMTRNFMGKFGKLSRVSSGLKVAGAVVAVAALAYTAYTIIKQEGVKSHFGWALAGVTVALNALYFGIIAGVSMIPVVGAVLAGLIVLSDFLVAHFTGTGWSERSIQSIVENMTDVHSLSGVDLVSESSETQIDDVSGNGFTAGDTFTYQANMRAIAYDMNEGDYDLDSTKIEPQFYFENSSHYDDWSSRSKYRVVDFGEKRWDFWELKAELRPHQAEINLAADLRFKSTYEVHYKECVDWLVVESCDNEKSTGEQSSDSRIYLDVLPDSLGELTGWSEIVPQNQQPWSEGEGYELESGVTLNVSAADGLLANDADMDGDVLEVRIIQQPAVGDLNMNNGTGAFTYKVKASAEPFYGEDRFTYVARDPSGKQSEETVVTLYVHRPNQKPIGQADVFWLEQDQEADLDVLANDQDADGDALQIRAVTQSEHGSLRITGNLLHFEPEEGWYGQTTVKYVLADAEDAAEVDVEATINVRSADAPLARADSYGHDEDVPLVVAAPGVLSNDVDAQGDPIFIASHTQPAHGQLTLNADGSFSYQPDADYYGADSFTYVATDGAHSSYSTEVNFQVAAVNDAPRPTADTYRFYWGYYEQSAQTGLLANDSEAEGQPMSVTLVTPPASGQMVLAADGSFEYTPAVDQYGSFPFTYKVSDGLAESSPMTSTLVVGDDFNRPLGLRDSYAMGYADQLHIVTPGVMKNDLAGWALVDIFPRNEQGALTGVNDKGQLGGYVLTQTGSEGIYIPEIKLYDPDAIKRFSVPGAEETRPQDLNNAGVLVGNTAIAGVLNGFFARKPATDWVINQLTKPGASKTRSHTLNSAERHGGEYEQAGIPSGYRHDGSQYLDFNRAGASSTTVTGMTDGDELAGYFTDADGAHGFFADLGAGSNQMVDVPYGSDTEWHGLSGHLVLAGRYRDMNSVNNAVLGVADGMGGYDFSRVAQVGWGRTILASAEGVNRLGWTVGSYDNRMGTYGFLVKPRLNAASVELLQPPAHGNLNLNADGGFDYELTDACYVGSDSFSYRVDDGRFASRPVWVDINVPYRDSDSDGVADCSDPDDDNDTVPDGADNCPTAANQTQTDIDTDGIGDSCDNCALVPNADQADADADGMGDYCDLCTDENGDGQCEYDADCMDVDQDGLCLRDDNCPLHANPGQEDANGNLIGDACDQDTDMDADGIWDLLDNCPGVANPGQEDDDSDGIGNACDGCLDQDQDQVCDTQDNCPFAYNPDQADSDGDGIADACDLCPDLDADGACDTVDLCPGVSDPGQIDLDGDGLGDYCDLCTDVDLDGQCDYTSACVDQDLDGVCAEIDNCPLTANPDQADADGDGLGDACDQCQDIDQDGLCEGADNCPLLANADQLDIDADGLGDACDAWIDQDQDTVPDSTDLCPTVYDPEQTDLDADGVGDACDACVDQDQDGLCDRADNCPVTANADQADADGDGLGDLCDACQDVDQDGVCDSDDNCPAVANPGQEDADFDDVGDACDICADSDQDGLCDTLDNCPVKPNPDQADQDSDGFGDACDQCQGTVPDGQQTVPSAEGGALVTLDVSASCKGLANVRTESTQGNSPVSEYRFPLGLFHFEVEGMAAGELVEVEMVVPLDEAIVGYYKRNLQSGEWQDVANAITHDAASGVTRISFRLAEGGSFDADMEPSRITDPGGPVALAASVDIETREIPTMSVYSIGLLGLMMMLAGMHIGRRRYHRRRR